jgi:hypothetical protein
MMCKVGICKSQISVTELRKNLDLKPNVHFSVGNTDTNQLSTNQLSTNQFVDKSVSLSLFSVYTASFSISVCIV